MSDMTQAQKQDDYWMRIALEQAQLAAKADEVPVGAVLIANNEIIASAYNQPIGSHDPCAHAEVLALRLAAIAMQNYRLPNTTLYVTIEPCTMCFGAIMHSRIKRLVYGAIEPKAGVVTSQLQLAEQPFYNHDLDIQGGVLAQECGAIISDFFTRRRREKKAQQ